MNTLIGSIKHCDKDRINNWVESALKNCKGEIVLLVLDKDIPDSILSLKLKGVKVIHMPTAESTDINICKWERHIKVREYIKRLDENDVVLLTDTLDVVFQKDPFEWFEKNAKKDIVLTSEGILHNDEPWNMRSILTDHKEFADEIRMKEVVNSGIIIGKVKSVSNILLHIYTSTKGLNPESADQPAMNVCLLSSFIKDQIQIINSDDNFVIHCAVAGPTELFHAWRFNETYKYGLPVIQNNEIINSKTNETFCLVHQYNRIPEWNNFFNEKYREIKEKIQIDKNTLVSALFNIGRENWKHSGFGKNNDRYKSWIKNFLSLNTSIVLFVDEYYYDYVLNLRSSYDPNNEKTKIIKISIDQLNFYQSFYNGISCLLFSPEFRKKVWFEVAEMKYTLYNIVNYGKIEFIKRAKDLDNSNSSNFIWVDAGGFREDFSKYENLNWPTRISELYTGKVVHFTHNSNFNLHPNKDEYFRSQNRNIQGVCMIVPKEQVDFYYRKVYEEIELMIKEKTLGSDEKIYDSIYKKFGDSIDLIKCGWFGFFDLLKN